MMQLIQFQNFMCSCNWRISSSALRLLCRFFSVYKSFNLAYLLIIELPTVAGNTPSISSKEKFTISLQVTDWWIKKFVLRYVYQTYFYNNNLNCSLENVHFLWYWFSLFFSRVAECDTWNCSSPIPDAGADDAMAGTGTASVSGVAVVVVPLGLSMLRHHSSHHLPYNWKCMFSPLFQFEPFRYCIFYFLYLSGKFSRGEYVTLTVITLLLKNISFILNLKF